MHQWGWNELYILGEVRVKSGGTQFLTPAVTHHITQKVRPQTLQYGSVFDYAALLNFFFLSLFTYFPDLNTEHHGNRHLHPHHTVQDLRWERWICQHSEQRRIPKSGDLSATQLCEGKP